jgi:hypothetical protein
MKLNALLSLAALISSTLALAATDRDVSDCEFYVDDFAVVATGAYGSGNHELRANLKVRSDLSEKVISAGAIFLASGTYTKEGQTWSEPVTSLNATAERTMSGKFLQVDFLRDWDTYGQDIGDRSISAFTYYVTIRETNGEATTYWLKKNGSDFSNADIAPENWYYSEGIFLGGYSTARYLWRDGGSPLFANRTSCVGR